ncbi:Lrp/AsnC family transcriptional regulator [Fodinibius sediminis]|uniref:Transcriptional regulator, AsnC family n=1 Tax=Fodinibius sediminis TaxID=1214077 RepID=A0A521BF25_9BACT|nr:Lrp/AsnC ligand binding domain-containing protein [Fodinibius sediminis]SMO45679.1 transcriptional regulator, AsnC family [Fodinibius sediminis]
MVTALVFITTERTRINEVAEKLVEIKGVSEVYSISGQYDLVAMIRVKENDEMAELITSQLAKVEGITDTETHIAFRTFSRHDLEHMFSIGFED